MREFRDIKLKGLDKHGIRQGRTEVLFDIPLILSDRPPRVWGDIFEDEWKKTWYTMYRRAYVSGDRIVIQSAGLDEIDKYHLEHLKKAVEHTNSRYRDYAKRLEAQKAREAREEAQTQAEIDALESRLKFD